MIIIHKRYCIFFLTFIIQTKTVYLGNMFEAAAISGYNSPLKIFFIIFLFEVYLQPVALVGVSVFILMLQFHWALVFTFR